MNLRPSIERHPELYLVGLSAAGIFTILCANLDVTLRSTPAGETAAMQSAADVRELLARAGAPRQDLPDLTGRVRADWTRVDSPRRNPDGTAYYATEIERIFVTEVGPARPRTPRDLDHLPPPLPAVTLAASESSIDVSWTLSEGKVTQTAAFEIARRALTGPDGRERPNSPAEVIVRLPFGDGREYRDAKVEPGCTYEYAVRTVDGNRTAESAPVAARIPLPYRFHLSGVANGQAVFQVEKFFGASRGWRKARFVVSPGGPIGGRLDSTIFGDEFGPIDFSTGFVLAEIRQEKSASGGRGSQAVALPLTVVEIRSERHGSQMLRLER